MLSVERSLLLLAEFDGLLFLRGPSTDIGLVASNLLCKRLGLRICFSNIGLSLLDVSVTLLNCVFLLDCCVFAELGESCKANLLVLFFPLCLDQHIIHHADNLVDWRCLL